MLLVIIKYFKRNLYKKIKTHIYFSKLLFLNTVPVMR